MFNFKDIVSDILLEQEQQLPDWFNNIIKKHNEVFSTNITDNELTMLWSLVAGKSYVADRDIAANFQIVRIIDILSRLYNSIKTQPNFPSKIEWKDFKGYIAQYDKQKGEEIYNQIKNVTPATKELWLPLDPSVRRGYEKALAEGDKLSSAALTTYDTQSVVDTVQQIINKRINVFTRVAKLKNPKTPFSNLIQDIFKQPELYLSGQKKYSSDFEAIDDLYIKDIIKVAMAAKDFYAAEIAKLKMQQLENSSLQLLKNHTSKILKELTSAEIAAGKKRAYFDKPVKQNQPEQQQFNKEVFDKLYDTALKDATNRLNFLSGKTVTYIRVDNNGKETGQQGITDPAKYTVGNIRKMENNEARELVRALQDISLYTKKRPGAGERVSQRLQALGSAAGNIAAFAGAKLYGT